MANKNIDALVYCPFYITETSKSISCEGMVGKLTVSRFGSASDKKHHQFNFCTGKSCVGCPVYKGVIENYSDEEREATEKMINMHRLSLSLRE